MVNAIYCGLCISQSADEAHHGPSITGEGREGAMIDRGVNILQVRFCHTFERIEVLSREIFLQLAAKMC